MLQSLFNGVPIGTAPNDKPIAGSLLPFLFGSTALVLIVVGLSLYSIGYWNLDLSTSSNKGRTDIAVMAVLVVSGFLIFYTPFALFPLVLAGLYLLATNIE